MQWIFFFHREDSESMRSDTSFRCADMTEPASLLILLFAKLALTLRL